MAVSIDSTNLVDIDAAEATTGWTSSMGSLAANALGPREGTNNIQDQASEETYEVYHTITAEDYNGRTIFGWQLSGGPDTEANDGFGMYLGDGTNNIAYTVGGVDNPGFQLLGYSMFRLNVDDRPTALRALGGSDGSLDEANITRIGYAGNFPGKASGNADNVKFDVLRYCANINPALLVEGGTTGDRGTYQECVTADESTAAGDAWGIFRILTQGSKAYEQNFGVQMGSLDADSYFEDDAFQLYLNGNAPAGASIAAGSMDVDIVGDSGSTNFYNITNFFIQSLGAVSNWTLSADVDEAIWADGQFVDMGTFTFPAQDAGNKSLINITFVNCAQVTFEGIDATNIVFNGTTDANGAVYWDEGTVEENQDNLTFNSDGTGHAIEINPTGAGPFIYNIDGYTFDGYAGQSGTAADRVFFINPATLSADITINFTNSSALDVQGGGSGFSFREVASYTGTVTINNIVTLQVTVVDELNVAVPYATVSILDASDRSIISEGVANNLGVYTDSTYNYTGDVGVLVVVRKSSPGDTRYLPVEPPATIVSTGLAQTVGLTSAPFAGAVPMTGVLRHGVQSEDVNDATITITIDVPKGVNRKLYVAGMYWNAGANLFVSTATYDGNAMTFINSRAGGSGSINEILAYYYDIPDSHEGTKDIVFTFSAAVNIKAVAFAIMDDIVAGGVEDSAASFADSQTTNPTFSLENDVSTNAFSIGFILTDDLDSPTATGESENRVRRSDLARDGLAQSITIIIADRSGAVVHSIGADYGANSKSWVGVAAAWGKN